MTLREKIILTLKETVHIRIDYTNFPKDRSFIMITTYPAIFNIIIDSTTPRIAMLANSIDKPLKIYKGTRLNIIHKFVKTAYFLTDTFKMAIALVAATITLSKPLSQAQRDIILGLRYQYISLNSLTFSDQIVTIDAKFTLTLKMEVKLTYNPSSSTTSNRATPNQTDTLFYILIRFDSSTPFTDIIYTIIERKNTI